MTRRRIKRVIIGLVLLGGAVAAIGWWARHELGSARDEMAGGQTALALSRLERLNRLPALARPAESDYLLGMARWAAGRYQPALQAFARIPPGSEFESRVAMFQAEAALREGRLRE